MYKVLIIEDEPSYQQLLKNAFEKEQFKVVLASGVKQGITEIAKITPNIILLDIMLPGGMNGFDLLEQLKVKENTKNIPVIVLTNLDSEEKVAKEIGASSYFIKSDTSIQEIIKKARQLMS